jgi:hypothetical protein
MATALQESNTEEQHSLVLFFVGKMTQCKGIHKETFPVCSRKYLSRKAVRKWAGKRGKRSLMTKRMKRRLGSG